MERKVTATQADFQRLLNEHPLLEMLTPLAQEQLKVITMDRLLTEAETRASTPQPVPTNGEVPGAEVDKAMQAAWAKE